MINKYIDPIAGLVFAALYVSEQWYTLFEWERPYIKIPQARVPAHRVLYYKARGIVVFDRVLTGMRMMDNE